MLCTLNISTHTHLFDKSEHGVRIFARHNVVFVLGRAAQRIRETERTHWRALPSPLPISMLMLLLLLLVQSTVLIVAVARVVAPLQHAVDRARLVGVRQPRVPVRAPRVHGKTLVESQQPPHLVVAAAAAANAAAKASTDADTHRVDCRRIRRSIRMAGQCHTVALCSLIGGRVQPACTRRLGLLFIRMCTTVFVLRALDFVFERGDRERVILGERNEKQRGRVETDEAQRWLQRREDFSRLLEGARVADLRRGDAW